MSTATMRNHSDVGSQATRNGTAVRAVPLAPGDVLNAPLEELDPAIAAVLADELARQQQTLEMIASENFAPRAVLECQGSVLTNKYAEGYPGKRYYGGCEHVDISEQLAIDRALALFGGEHANVQPHSGAQANAAVFHALLEPGDTIMGLELAHGGHLTHGMKLNVSGRLFNVVAYGVDPSTHLIDMDALERSAHQCRPRMIIAGWSAYPRHLDFARFRQIADDVGALLMVDMAHFAGLVAARLHPNPVPFADVVSTTIHKTLGGARGGMIICQQQHAKKINSAVFPGQQGGPLEHVIAGKAVALKIAASAGFRERQQRTLAGARVIAERLSEAGNGIRVLTGGTDVHLVIADLRESELDGRQAEDRLNEIGITVNRNAVPFDPRPPMISSGLRVGTSALATRGVQIDEFDELGRIIAAALGPDFEAHRVDLRQRAAEIADRHPLYAHLPVS
ncbi:MAG TPA: serine hydroxymethyltransferase [Solirubrobacteraceae bacterium]|nr:serine hydroxymethyltransferase [Solirubrobacteraceae bacterium]